LRRYLQQGPSASVKTALKLGHKAVALGLETLDVARIHKEALETLASSASSSGDTRHKEAEQAKVFFAETIVPIEGTHRVALEAAVRIDQLAQRLRQRVMTSCASVGQLEQTIAQRREVEELLEQRSDRHAKLLAEAERLQKKLRHQICEILSTHEDERQKHADELRNEIAQALVAIDLDLLMLKTLAGGDTERLEKEIANAERLVAKLAKRGRG